MSVIQFPKDFVWGVATSAYQIEGAAFEDGRGPSIWDTFSHTPGNIIDDENGDVACDSYHRLDEDIALLKELGVNSYRFSVSWPRVIPDGTGKVNKKGLQYYENLVDQLLEHGIEPMCTLYHWDLPQKLEEKGGWDNRDTIDAFVEYAKVMFERLNGKVKRWITLNEPWCASFLSHYIGEHAPGNQDLQLAVNVAHHLLMAHGKTVQAFRELAVEGEIGYAPNVTWLEPYSRKSEDMEACRRGNGWFIEWFMDPVFKGEYPAFLTNWFADKGITIPLKDGDLEVISQPVDFLGINYYNGNLARHKANSGLFDVENIDAGYDKTDFDWFIYPDGFYSVLLYVKKRYGNIPVYITENGACYDDVVENGRVRDEQRIAYIKKHLIALNRCLESGVNIKGYHVWSLLDNFEWAYGYTKRFGIVHVDFQTLKRIPKDSYYWYQKLIRNNWFTI